MTSENPKWFSILGTRLTRTIARKNRRYNGVDDE